MTKSVPDMAQKVLDFWFDETNQPYWFEKNDDFDKKISQQFSSTLDVAKSS